VLDVQASRQSNRPCWSSYLARYCPVRQRP